MNADRNRPHLLSAYGGDGWQPRSHSLAGELGNIWGNAGQSSEWQALKAVLLHRPGQELNASADPKSVQMVAPLDLDRAQQQHEQMAQAYRAAGVRVHYLEPTRQPNPNQMFMADLMFMTPEGAILARPASDVRAGEEREAARALAALGIPIVRSISGRGTFEGADAMWLSPKKVIVGRGLRTNAEGAAQIRSVLAEMGVETIVVDMPVGTMHLMGMLRIINRDLAIAWPVRLVYAAVDALREEGYQVAFLPEVEEAIHNAAFNFVTLGPRKILMPAGNPITQEFYESLDIECVTTPTDELFKAAGSVGCLTGILEREQNVPT